MMLSASRWVNLCLVENSKRRCVVLSELAGVVPPQVQLSVLTFVLKFNTDRGLNVLKTQLLHH